MIQMRITNRGTAIEITDTQDFMMIKYLHLTPEEQEMVRGWKVRAEALMTEKGGRS